MNDLLTFDFDERAVRVIQRDGNPWWVAADVAAILGYDHTPHMLRILDDDEKGVHIVDPLYSGNTPSGGAQTMTIISESGLFAAILKSRKPEARAFRRWVTGTVLPALRRTGRFVLGEPAAPTPATMDPAVLNAAVAAVRESRRLFGPGIARAVWRDFGLPMPAEAQDMLPDGMMQAVAVWVQGRDRFTTGELADALGLGDPDPATARRLSEALRALGFERRRFRRRKALLWGWDRPAVATAEAA